LIGNYIINFMAIGLALILGKILCLIYLKGVVEVTEPRRWVLITELVLMVTTIGLATWNLIKMVV